MLTDWFWSADYSVARFLLTRGIAAIYLIAFVVALRQFPALLGERGLLPVPEYLRHTTFRATPTIFHWHYSDRALVVISWVGIALSAALLIGPAQMAPLPLTMLAWAVLWVLYLSIVNVGQTFYAFGWESLLLEAGFLAVFLGSDATVPATPVLFAFRWLTFRVEFGAGLIKLRGDPCWRDLTCMRYHHETQPMPNPLSRYFHFLPAPVHRLEVLGNHVAQLVVPWGLFLPQPIAALAALYMIGTQMYLVISGNYAWLNWITIVAATAALPDALLRLALPIDPPALHPAPPWYAVLVVALAVLVVVLSYWPVRNMMGRQQMMNFSFNQLHIVNTYGAFGSVTREREEVVIEGTSDAQPSGASEWREYGFKGKPVDPGRRPPQVAPYHLRLDWLMWFLPFSPAYAGAWFPRFIERLLQGDAATLRLLRHNPFPDTPPRAVRARLYRYRYATPAERHATGNWWERQLVSDYLPPVALREP